jgi:hypothetical protein
MGFEISWQLEWHSAGVVASSLCLRAMLAQALS